MTYFGESDRKRYNQSSYQMFKKLRGCGIKQSSGQFFQPNSQHDRRGFQEIIKQSRIHIRLEYYVKSN